MSITAEALRQEVANLEKQAQEFANAYQQAIGALQLARALLAQMEASPENGLTVEQFAQAIGGNGATAVIEER